METKLQEGILAPEVLDIILLVGPCSVMFEFGSLLGRLNCTLVVQMCQ